MNFARVQTLWRINTCPRESRNLSSRTKDISEAMPFQPATYGTSTFENQRTERDGIVASYSTGVLGQTSPRMEGTEHGQHHAMTLMEKALFSTLAASESMRIRWSRYSIASSGTARRLRRSNTTASGHSAGCFGESVTCRIGCTASSTKRCSSS